MRRVCLMAPVILVSLAAWGGDVVTPEPTRIVIECEDMAGVAQDRFGPGAGWQVGRWGHDLLQNMVFGGPWASRLRAAMTDAGDNPAEMTAEFDVPVAGMYKVWVKYECPPGFNYAFGVKLEGVGALGGVALNKVYGLREAAKHYCFMDKLHAGDLYWSWGIDHDAAEGYEAALAKGRYRLTIAKTANPAPAGPRSLDAILITSDLAAISTPRYSRYPLLDELRRANHVYFRFRNPARAATPVLITWNHWNHRYEDFYSPAAAYRELVRFYDENGVPVEGGKNGDWPNPIQPGAASPWYDLGPTMNTESTSPYLISAYPPGGKPDDPSQPVEVDLALAPNAGRILASFALAPGERALGILVQPDLHRPEGLAYTKKTGDIYAELARELNAEPRLGPLPRKLRLYGGTGTPLGFWMDAGGMDLGMTFREALGLNTLSGVNEPPAVHAMQAWGEGHGGIIERSLAYQHSQDPQQVIKWVKDGSVEKQFRYLSFGDEIGLPAVDVNDVTLLETFRAYLREHGETPESLGLATWEQVKPLAALSGDVAVQIGVLPEAKKADAGSLAGLKKLYWYSLGFRTEQGIAAFAEKTRVLKAALGDEVHTSANLGGMHPFYWMHQSSFIESFKGKAMSLAWSEDYTYCQPEGSRLVAEFQAAYLRKGASYHDTPMMFYCMPHWPGNNPEQLLQNAVLEWGQNVKDLDFFNLSPDIWSTENYVAYRGGLPVFRAVRTISGMAGLIEDHLLPARTVPARVAMLLSEASDVWETEGKGQGAVEPGSVASNVSQEERKDIWYALRYAGYRVDHITEKDCADGLLAGYAVLYVCGQNLERKAAQAVRDWVRGGGVVFATAGAARKDEFDARLTDLDEVFGRGRAVSYERYKGPLRARIELPFVKALDEVRWADGKVMPAYCSREEFAADRTAQVLAAYRAGKPALIAHEFGQGRAYYTGVLPGQSWLKPALPALPQGKGGPHGASHMAEWQGWDAVAAGMILLPVVNAGIRPDVVVGQPGVVVNRLAGPASTVITVVNLALEARGELREVELRVNTDRPVRRAWSCFHAKGLPLNLKAADSGVASLVLPTLGPADVVVLEH
jgi:hypothetical protein